MNKNLNTTEKIIHIIGLISIISIPITLIILIWLPNITNIDYFYLKLLSTEIIIFIVCVLWINYKI